MPDLSVDLSLLERAAGALSMLIEELSNSSSIVTFYEDAVGESRLQDALRSFADDWKTHREDLLTSMQSVWKMASQGHHTYIAADDKLAADIRGAYAGMASAAGGGGERCTPGRL